MGRARLRIAFVLAGIAAVVRDGPADSPALIASSGSLPEFLSTYDRLAEASSWYATPDSALVAAVLQPRSGTDRPTSEIVLFSAAADPPETLAIPGFVADILLVPTGETLFAIQVRSRLRNNATVRLIQIEIDTLRAGPSVGLAVTARALAHWPETNTLLIGADDEVRSLLLPGLRSGRVYPIRGATSALAVLGDGLLLVGQDRELLLVDPNRPAATDGLEPVERVPMTSAVSDLSAGTGDGPALGRLSDGTWFEVRRNPLRVETRGSAAGLLRVARTRQTTVRTEERPSTRERAPAISDASTHAPEPFEADLPKAEVLPTETLVENDPPPPAGVQSAQVWGHIIGAARTEVEAIVFLGPGSIAQEALRTGPDDAGHWFANGLAAGRYRIVLIGRNGRALSVAPPFATVELASGAGPLRAPEFEIRGVR